jgi:hypothetical protein
MTTESEVFEAAADAAETLAPTATKPSAEVLRKVRLELRT